MKAPILHLDDDQELAVTAAPVELLRVFVAGHFDATEIDHPDDPAIARAIAKRLLAEKESAQ